MKYIDPEICDNLANDVIKERKNLLSFIKNFCTHGQMLSGTGEKTYGFNKHL